MRLRRLGQLVGRLTLVALPWPEAAWAPALIYDPPTNMRLVSRMGGLCSAVGVEGHHALVAEGGNLTILDVTDPFQPLALTHVSFGDFFIGEMQIRDGLAFLSGGVLASSRYGFQIVDVTDPRSPRIRGYCALPLPPGRFHVLDSLAYVACSDARVGQGGFEIIDVSEPSSPTRVGSYISTMDAWRAYARAKTVYLAATDGLHIYDVTEPTSPKPLAVYPRSGCYDVVVSGNLAYIGSYGGLEIVDVSSPTAPVLKGGLYTSQVHGVFVSEDLAYLARWHGGATWFENGLAVVNISNPSSPTMRGSYYTSGTAVAVTAASGTAYLADRGGGLSIINVTDPSSPALCATYDTVSDPRDVVVADGIAYIANGVRGLKTVDVSNPWAPKALGSLALPNAATRIGVSRGMAYVGGYFIPRDGRMRALLQIVDVTAPSTPKWLGVYDMVTSLAAIGDIAISNDLVFVTYVAGADTGFRIIDANEPSSPVLLGSFRTEVWATDIAVSVNLAFVTDYSNLQIVDVSDPTSPVLRSAFRGDGWGRIYDVFVADGIAYMTGVRGSTGADFACLDISNPIAPRLLGTYDLPGWTDSSVGLHVSNGLAYVIMDGLRVLDVSDPAKPTLAGFFPTGGFGGSSFCDVFSHGNLAYVVDPAGLRIFQYARPSVGAQHWRRYR